MLKRRESKNMVFFIFVDFFLVYENSSNNIVRDDTVFVAQQLTL